MYVYSIIFLKKIKFEIKGPLLQILYLLQFLVLYVEHKATELTKWSESSSFLNEEIMVKQWEIVIHDAIKSHWLLICVLSSNKCIPFSKSAE